MHNSLISPLDPMPLVPVSVGKNCSPLFRPHPGAFGVDRHEHVHTGTDLYASHGTPVRAMEKGRIVSIEWFTGIPINLPWWNDTRAVYVAGECGVFNYGEIQELPTLKVGQTVRQGEILGHVLTVLKKAKGRPMSMLHVELYDHGYTDEWGEWKIGAPKPEHLKDPTPYLLSIEGAKGIDFDPYWESSQLYLSFL